jgi:hypothetical protein
MRIAGPSALPDCCATAAIVAPYGAKSFHEKAGECQVISFIFLSFSSFFFISSFSKLFPLSQAASVATLPSALFVERLSLGASWVYSIQ